MIVRGSVRDTAKHFKREPDTVASILEDAKQKLYEVRTQRPKPHLDTKMITAWNGEYAVERA